MSANLKDYEAILDTNIWYYCANTSPSNNSSEIQRQADIRRAIEDFKNNNRLLISEYSLWECVSHFYSKNVANFWKSLEYIASNQIDVINIDGSVSSIVGHNKYGCFLGINDFSQVKSQLDSIIRYKARHEASALAVWGQDLIRITSFLLAGNGIAQVKTPYRFDDDNSRNSNILIKCVTSSWFCNSPSNLVKAIEDKLYDSYKNIGADKPENVFKEIFYDRFYESTEAIIAHYYQLKGGQSTAVQQKIETTLRESKKDPTRPADHIYNFIVKYLKILLPNEDNVGHTDQEIFVLRDKIVSLIGQNNLRNSILSGEPVRKYFAKKITDALIKRGAQPARKIEKNDVFDMFLLIHLTGPNRVLLTRDKYFNDMLEYAHPESHRIIKELNLDRVV